MHCRRDLPRRLSKGRAGEENRTAKDGRERVRERESLRSKFFRPTTRQGRDVKERVAKVTKYVCVCVMCV